MPWSSLSDPQHQAKALLHFFSANVSGEALMDLKQDCGLYK